MLKAAWPHRVTLRGQYPDKLMTSNLRSWSQTSSWHRIGEAGCWTGRQASAATKVKQDAGLAFPAVPSWYGGGGLIEERASDRSIEQREGGGGEGVSGLPGT